MGDSQLVEDFMIGGNAVIVACLVLWLLGLALAVLWICLPFAVFGLKALVGQAIGEAEKANTLLRQICEQNRVLMEQQRVLVTRWDEKRHP
jgi:hypothetical protein